MLKLVTYPFEKLPVSVEHETDLSQRIAQLYALLENRLRNIPENRKKPFDMEMQIFLKKVFDDGYNKGLADMNKMIALLENDD
jgi:hypothetical protein